MSADNSVDGKIFNHTDAAYVAEQASALAYEFVRIVGIDAILEPVGIIIDKSFKGLSVTIQYALETHAVVGNGLNRVASEVNVGRNDEM